MNRGRLLPVVGVVLVVTAWVALRPGTGPASTPRLDGSNVQGAPVAPGGAATPRGGNDVDRRTAAPAAWSIHIEKHGQPVDATCSWSHGRTATSVLGSLVATLGPSSTAGLHARVRADDTLRIHPQPGEWTRLIVRAGDDARDVVLEPIAGPSSRLLDLTDPSSTVRVQVLRPDARTPAVGVTVVAEATPTAPGWAPRGRAAGMEGLVPGAHVPATANGSATDALRAVTDADGRAEIRWPEAAAFVVRLEGLDEARLRPPHAQRIVLPEGPRRSARVTLIQPPTTHELRLRILASIAPAPAPGGKLVLRRIDGDATVEAPVPGFLRPGTHEATVELEPGTWIVDALPQHAYAIAPRDPVRIPEALDLAIRIEDRPARTAVRLDGVPMQHHPLRVHVRAQDAVHRHRPDLQFYGHRQWGHGPGAVPSVEHPCRLVARGRGSVWISDSLPSIRGREQTVSMHPACMVTVRWNGWDPVLHHAAHLSIEVAADEESVRSFWVELSRRSGMSEPARIARLAVPRGRATISALTARGAVAWQTVRLLDGADVVVDVRGSKPQE